jgi:acetyl esterase/lipase
MADPTVQSLPLWPAGAPRGERALPDQALEEPRLTPFLLPGERSRGCVIVCPGGGYHFRAEHEGAPLARWCNRLGLHGFVLDYRVKARSPASLHDAQRAIRTVRHRAAEWRVDPARIGILGFSAGGHLAASASTLFDEGQPGATDPIDRHSSRPDASILCYPVITAYAGRHQGSIATLLGEEPWDEAARARVSLERQVGPRTPPAFLWHTSDDGPVPVSNSLGYAGALAAQRIPFALHVFPHGHHGLGLASEEPTVAAWGPLCARWLAEIGFVG